MATAFRLLDPFSRVSRPLVAVFVAMLVLTFAALAGLVLDPRVITGAPAWLKPLKFAISTAIYSLSFAWLLGHVQGRRRLVRIASRVTAAALAIELALIFLQAARGTTSHFNLATAFDFAVFQIMGFTIVALDRADRDRRRPPPAAVRESGCRRGPALRARAHDPGGGHWLPDGHPQRGSLEAAWQGGKLLVVGSHTIGGSDGGAGLPLVNWSREHGDLRAAHFLGLHALQLLPLFAWAPARVGVAAVQHARLVVVGGSSYLALLVILVVQGCRESRCSRPAG